MIPEEEAWLSGTGMFSMQKVSGQFLAFPVNEYQVAGIRTDFSQPETLQSSLNRLLPASSTRSCTYSSYCQAAPIIHLAPISTYISSIPRMQTCIPLRSCHGSASVLLTTIPVLAESHSHTPWSCPLILSSFEIKRRSDWTPVVSAGNGQSFFIGYLAGCFTIFLPDGTVQCNQLFPCTLSHNSVEFYYPLGALLFCSIGNCLNGLFLPFSHWMAFPPRLLKSVIARPLKHPSIWTIHRHDLLSSLNSQLQEVSTKPFSLRRQEGFPLYLFNEKLETDF